LFSGFTEVTAETISMSSWKATFGYLRMLHASLEERKCLLPVGYCFIRDNHFVFNLYFIFITKSNCSLVNLIITKKP
jgi:hypothetical protein